MNKKAIALGALFFIGGGVGGYFFTHANNDKSGAQGKTPTQRNVLRQAPQWQKKFSQESTYEYSSFTGRKLKSFMGRLSSSHSSQLEDLFQELLRYPYRKGDDKLQFAMQHLFSVWGQREPHRAMEAVMSLSDSWIIIKKHLVPTALAFQIENNPTEVAAWYENPSNRLYAYKEQILPALSTALTQKSPEEAWKWLSSLGYREQNYALPEFFSELYRSHPDQIKLYINQLEDPEHWGLSPTRDPSEHEKIYRVAEAYAKCDYEEAEQWVARFPSYWRKQIEGKLVGVYAATDLLAATEKLKTTPSGLEYVADAAVSTDDLATISKWLHKLVEIDPPASTGSYSFIGNINAGDSKRMIEELPPGRVKDSLIYCHIINNANMYPPDWDLFVNGIKNDDLRQKALEQLNKVRAKSTSFQKD